MKRSIKKIEKGIKQEYNINSKYLSRMATVFPKANKKNLFAGIQLRLAPIPIIGFRPKQTGSAISVTIKKGKTEVFRHAFIRTMTNVSKTGDIREHEGLWFKGVRGQEGKSIKTKNYSKEEKNYKYKITEYKTTSPFAMGTSKTVASEIQSFMGSEVLKRVEGILRGKVDKIAMK